MPNPEGSPQLSLVTVLKGAGFSFLGTVLGRVLVFVAKAIIGGALGADLFGLFNIGFSSLVLLQFVLLGGLYEGVATYISRYRAEGQLEGVARVVFTGLALAVVVGTGLAALVFVAAEPVAAGLFGDPRLTAVFRTIALLLPLYCLSQVVLGYLRGIKQIRQMVIARNLAGDVGLIACVGAATVLGLGITEAFGAFAVKHLLIIAAAAWFIARSELAATWRSHARRAIDGPLVRYSIPVTAALTLETVRLYIETLVLGSYVDSEQVGYFSAALLISMLLLIIGAVFRPVLLPVIAELHVGRRARDIFRLYVIVVKYVTFAATPCALALMLFPEAIIRLVFNPGYLDATLSLRLLGVAYFVSTCLGNYTVVFYATGRQKLDVWVKGAGTAVSLALNFLLIPRYGLVGAAIAHSASLIGMEVLGAVLATHGHARARRLLQPGRVLLLSAFVFMLETVVVRFASPAFGVRAWDVAVIAVMIIVNWAAVARFVPLDARERVILARARSRLFGADER